MLAQVASTACINSPLDSLRMYIGLPTTLSPCCRQGIGTTRTAALMTCSQIVSVYAVHVYVLNAALNPVGMPSFYHYDICMLGCH